MRTYLPPRRLSGRKGGGREQFLLHWLFTIQQNPFTVGRYLQYICLPVKCLTKQICLLGRYLYGKYFFRSKHNCFTKHWVAVGFVPPPLKPRLSMMTPGNLRLRLKDSKLPPLGTDPKETPGHPGSQPHNLHKKTGSEHRHYSICSIS
jgi:hypothetical protein